MGYVLLRLKIRVCLELSRVARLKLMRNIRYDVADHGIDTIEDRNARGHVDGIVP
jgi:hypothetical protein